MIEVCVGPACVDMNAEAEGAQQTNRLLVERVGRFSIGGLASRLAAAPCPIHLVKRSLRPDVAGSWSRLSNFGALLRRQRSAAAARLSLLNLALLRGLTLPTLTWLWTLALLTLLALRRLLLLRALLGLAGALGLVLRLARLHLIFLTLGCGTDNETPG